MEDEPASVAAKLAKTFEQSWNERDGSGYGTAYWPDAELVDPTGQIWDGREAIERMHVTLWNGPASATNVQAAVRRMRIFGSDVMVLDLEVDVRGFSPSPPGAMSDINGTVKARLKHVVERRNGEWKIAASQNTFVAAPPSPIL